MKELDIPKVLLGLSKIKYNGNNEVIRVACGKYEIPTIKKLISNIFRPFRKTIIIDEKII